MLSKNDHTELPPFYLTPSHRLPPILHIMDTSEQSDPLIRRRSTRHHVPNINQQEVLTLAQALQLREQMRTGTFQSVNSNLALITNQHTDGYELIAADRINTSTQTPMLEGLVDVSANPRNSPAIAQSLSGGSPNENSSDEAEEPSSHLTVSTMSASSLFANLFVNGRDVRTSEPPEGLDFSNCTCGVKFHYLSRFYYSPVYTKSRDRCTRTTTVQRGLLQSHH